MAPNYANCAHCGAMLRNGQFDWVLAEITQDAKKQPMLQGLAYPGGTNSPKGSRWRLP